jgi:hypothetical protein
MKLILHELQYAFFRFNKIDSRIPRSNIYRLTAIDQRNSLNELTGII